MARDTIISSNGTVAVAGDLYGKYLYPSSDAAVANVLEVTDEEFEQMAAATAAVEASSQPQFWADFQDSGKREDYSYAFANWNAESIVPIYGLNKVDKCMYALMNCRSLKDARSITFNITNENPNMMYVCVNCNSMTNAPQFVFAAGPTIVRTYTSLYASCYKLQTATVYWGDGTADPIGDRNSCQNMFFRCYELRDIDFGNENTGSPIYLDLSYTEVLSLQSIESLYRSLQDVSKAESGVYEITLSNVTLDGLTDEMKQQFLDKGWTLIGETRPPIISAETPSGDEGLEEDTQPENTQPEGEVEDTPTEDVGEESGNEDPNPEEVVE